MSEQTVLVATDQDGHAKVIQRILENEFDNVVVTRRPEAGAEDFDKHRPRALVLAFDTLDEATHFHLGLYRQSTLIQVIPHRVIVLCNKDEVHQAFKLCKQSHFDDYVLFWPMTHDAPRLAMCIHHAFRALGDQNTDLPTGHQLSIQAKRIAELESLLETYSQEGGRGITRAADALKQAEQNIDSALDDFCLKMAPGEQGGRSMSPEGASLREEMARVRGSAIAQGFESASAALVPMSEWAERLKVTFEPQLTAARSLQEMTKDVKPYVLIIDDDEFQQNMLARMLANEPVELAFAGSGKKLSPCFDASAPI